MNEPVQIDLFDYARLDVDSAEFVQAWTRRIKGLAKRVAGDVVEIGRGLHEVKEELGHGYWLPWLDAEFGWTDRQAERFMNVHAAFESDNLSNLAPIDVSALYLISAPSTPEPAREAVKETAAEGQKVSHAQAKAAVGAAKDAKAKGASSAEQKEAAKEAARLPTPSQARKLARETGRVVAATDGKLHTGKSAKEEREDAASTARIYAYVNPIRAIAEAKQEPEAWLAELPGYMRKTVNKHLGRAHARLNRLMEMWTHDEQHQVGQRHRDRRQGASSRAA
jgi:pyruvate/2-oxoglutarate dehydrogenase complex dihydrolipoamide acyltransferase (E2) component